ncbi:MAG: hypothetical protein KAJ79_01635 [Candidatus Omnitrophica bacterium]|nr:hypothetical protein [Candidatus Omnitrophota bacterium]
MFKALVIDIKMATIIREEMVSLAILPSEEGEIAILDFHQPLIACLTEGCVRLGEEFTLKIHRGLARVKGNKLVVLVEKK